MAVIEEFNPLEVIVKKTKGKKPVKKYSMNLDNIPGFVSMDSYTESEMTERLLNMLMDNTTLTSFGVLSEDMKTITYSGVDNSLGYEPKV